jgi:carbamoyl-phosphate synthase large subunit
MDWRGHKVLVTGGAGVIGREMIARLAAVGADLLTIDKADGQGLKGRFIRHDLSTGLPDDAISFRPQTIMHLAATFERTEEDVEFWEGNFTHNVLLSHMLLAATRGMRSLETLVFASSYLIYDPALYLQQREPRALNEGDPINPRNLVGIAKLQTERDIDFFQTAGMKYRGVNARIYRVYGRGSRDVISRWVRAALAGQSIEVFSDGNRFDYVFAGDVAEGLIRLVEQPEARGIVNLGSGVDHSITEVIEILRAEFPGVVVRHVDQAATGEQSRADMTLFRRLTGWVPSIELRDGIQRVIQFERDRQAGDVHAKLATPHLS